MTDINQLLNSDPDSWHDLTHAIAHGESIDSGPEIVRALLKNDTVEAWMSKASDALSRSEEFLTVNSPLKLFRAWFLETTSAAFDADDPLLWRVQCYAINHSADGVFSAAKDLFDRIPKASDLKAEVALLVVKGAFTEGDYQTAQEFAALATSYFASTKNTERASFAARKLGAAHLYLRNLENAFLFLDAPMRQRGPLFGGGGVMVFRSFSDPVDEAIDEAATISTWAKRSTPEWVRAIGGMAERWDDAHEADFLWQKFDEFMQHLLDETHNPESDIEVIVRHSGERGLTRTPYRALEAYVDAYPDDDWAFRQLDLIEGHLSADDLIARLSTDPNAPAGLLDLLTTFEEDGHLADTGLTFTIVDALVNHFISHQDRRAIELQERMLASKLAAYGECPAAWLERQNLGTVCSQLGEHERALALLEQTLTQQTEYFGASHHALNMTKRNLALAREAIARN